MTEITSIQHIAIVLGIDKELGSCIYEGEDVIVIVWRLSSLRTNLMSYLPKLLTSRQDEMNVVEGALDVHVTKDGRIYKIINRKITASDLEGAKVMAEIKKEANEKRLRAEKQKWANQLGSLTDDRANH
ncbi:unnamed protein product [Anisakis simplex]|uniref:Transposase n=1 Tax=Anisakis simplex TaxID=6269 RepID=A0A0M3J6B0_ANISI|nr:unnamed protein product [Anisakis simplex]